MKNSVKKLFESLFFRSPAQAANPNATPQSPDDPFTPPMPEQSQPIESFFEGDRFGPVQMGKVEFAGRDLSGQLVRGSANHHVMLGCKHLVRQIQPEQTDTQKTRGVAGSCNYCDLEIQSEQQRRITANEPLLPLSEAIRLTLVCTECARISVSGKLCCPRHSRIVDDGSGNNICLDVEELESQAKKTSVMKILMPLLSLFTEDADVSTKQAASQLPSPDGVEPDYDKQPNNENYPQ